MKNIKTITIISICCVIFAAAAITAFAVSESARSSEVATEPETVSEPADEAVGSEAFEMPEQYQIDPDVMYQRAYEKYVEIATDEQLRQIDALGALKNEKPRAVMTIMGDIDPEAKWLTLADVISVCEKADLEYVYDKKTSFMNYMVYLFNQIASAPDYCGGSGMVTASYTVKDGGKEYQLRISWFSAYLVDSEAKKQWDLLSMADYINEREGKVQNYDFYERIGAPTPAAPTTLDEVRAFYGIK